MNNTETYHDYLTELETWGVKEMNTAAPYLVQQFPELTLEDARKILREWSATRYQVLNENEGWH